MEFLDFLYREIVGFLGLGGVIEILKSGDFSTFLTFDGMLKAISPIVPLLLVLELINGIILKNPHTKVYKISFLIFVLNRFIGRFISIGATSYIIANFQKYAPFQTTFTWYWLIYGYIVWEFSHFIYHYLGHKVRLFWCLHATHHTPENMNLSVSHAHFFLEGPYADIIRSSICILFGIHPALLFFIMFIDGTYGMFIHIGENLMKNGKLGFLNHIILTPSHHRVHHARNPLYMDTNFCNLLNIWDKVFGTYQLEEDHVKIEYGITRPMDSGNILDVYFGEFIALFKDVWNAPTIKDKILYIFMPPGWHHTGEHKTASVVRREYLTQKS
ncbi:fatty acid hydroxylase [Emticicia oligotrophica DSM 17448]|uniref:Fatty acid hydroxylase n=1 Tax=Emticicia oligotrophica (strain DSM 17448 / CIP 109782 / MTCC 6937 / GPTSA100-15) TaxID=929562 RepID=A0ABM5MZT5_EMTOG|nr:sterol desaturase family protein [Emticicia oligotrophica]AFK02648.1 fatty acid hydroxylase [Emticicia oligotrophica DSM 17448]